MARTDLLSRIFDGLTIDFGERIMRRFGSFPFVNGIRGYRQLWPLLKNHLTLELGSERGFGSIGIPNCIRTDLRAINGVDVVCDATLLPFRDRVFDRTWSVYLAHHIPQLQELVNESRRVSKKLYLFDFFPRTFLHYFSVIWDWLFFRETITPANPTVLREIAPGLRIYPQGPLGSVLYVI